MVVSNVGPSRSSPSKTIAAKAFDDLPEQGRFCKLRGIRISETRRLLVSRCSKQVRTTGAKQGIKSISDGLYVPLLSATRRYETPTQMWLSSINRPRNGAYQLLPI